VVSKEKRKLLDLKRDAGKVNALKWKSTNQKCWHDLKPDLKHCIVLLPSVLNYTQRHNKDSSHEIYPVDILFLTWTRRTMSSAIMHDVADLVNDGASGDLGKAMCIHPEPYHRIKDFSNGGYDHNIIGLPIAKMCAGMVRTVDGYWTFLDSVDTDGELFWMMLKLFTLPSIYTMAVVVSAMFTGIKVMLRPSWRITPILHFPQLLTMSHRAM